MKDYKLLKNNHILIIENLVKKSKYSINDDYSENSLENIIKNVLTKNNFSNSINIKYISDDSADIKFFIENLDKDKKIILVIFENYNISKHENIIKIFKEKDINTKITVQIDTQKIHLSSKYQETMNIDKVIMLPITEKSYVNILQTLEII